MRMPHPMVRGGASMVTASQTTDSPRPCHPPLRHSGLGKKPGVCYIPSAMSGAKSRVRDNLQRVRDRIAAACDRAHRSVSDVALVAVTKSADEQAIAELVALGVADLGESRVQQLVARAEWLAARRPAPAVRWHMIGHLQRNKVKPVLEIGATIHSVDTLRLAEDIDARAAQRQQVADVMIEINCSGEGQKFGVAPPAGPHLAEQVSTLRHIRLVGLMTMAARGDNPEASRRAFARLREMFEEMRQERLGGRELRHLSMGMSQDFEIAIEEGATLVRIGGALFE